MKRYTADELRDLPTLTVGQVDNLKIDTDGIRVWLCRVSVEDGMPYDDQITVERYDPTTGRWETTDEYPG